MSSIPIGNFQIENLVKNRVPFFLFSAPANWSELFQGEDLKQIQKSLVDLPNFESQSILDVARSKKLAVDAPIVLVSEKVSAVSEAKALETAGFINVYYVLDGFQGLKASP